jgi:hypothetical protein
MERDAQTHTVFTYLATIFYAQAVSLITGLLKRLFYKIFWLPAMVF